jgi:hypothetical protein
VHLGSLATSEGATAQSPGLKPPVARVKWIRQFTPSGRADGADGMCSDGAECYIAVELQPLESRGVRIGPDRAP